MSGIKIVRRPMQTDVETRIIANSESIDLNDPVSFDGDGFLIAATAGVKLLGVFAKADTTVASDNETVGLVKGQYIPLDPSMVLEMTSDQACTDTDVGAYADLAVSGGVYTLNLAAGSSGQFLVIGYDPEGTGATTTVRVKPAERQVDAYAQA